MNDAIKSLIIVGITLLLFLGGVGYLLIRAQNSTDLERVLCEKTCIDRNFTYLSYQYPDWNCKCLDKDYNLKILW